MTIFKQLFSFPALISWLLGKTIGLFLWFGKTGLFTINHHKSRAQICGVAISRERDNCSSKITTGPVTLRCRSFHSQKVRFRIPISTQPEELAEL